MKKLLDNHFGPEWMDLQSLAFYDNLFTSQDSRTASPEENFPEYCEEPLNK